jgi:hypothetical protein
MSTYASNSHQDSILKALQDILLKSSDCTEVADLIMASAENLLKRGQMLFQNNGAQFNETNALILYDTLLKSHLEMSKIEMGTATASTLCQLIQNAANLYKTPVANANEIPIRMMNCVMDKFQVEVSSTSALFMETAKSVYSICVFSLPG